MLNYQRVSQDWTSNEIQWNPVKSHNPIGFHRIPRHFHRISIWDPRRDPRRVPVGRARWTDVLTGLGTGGANASGRLVFFWLVNSMDIGNMLLYIVYICIYIWLWKILTISITDDLIYWNHIFHFGKATFSLIFLHKQFNIHMHACLVYYTYIDRYIVSIDLQTLINPCSVFATTVPETGWWHVVCCFVRRVARLRNRTACGPACAMAA